MIHFQPSLVSIDFPLVSIRRRQQMKSAQSQTDIFLTIHDQYGCIRCHKMTVNIK
jgi:cytochrome c551/c552